MTKEELIEGEIYFYDDLHIAKYPIGGSLDNIEWTSKKSWRWNLSDIKNCTSEQKHWFLQCEKANKFIDYNTAMKTFNKELTKEEILAKARIDYPIGTVVNPVYLPKQTNTVSSDEFVWKEGVDGLGLCVKVKENLTLSNNMIAIYTPKKGFSTIVSKPEQQFIADKWYKGSASHLKQNAWYCKYSAKQDVSDRFYYDELICLDYTVNAHKYGWEKKHNWCVLSINYELVTDLSEIQQWLPDGHIDKIQTNIMEEKKYNYHAVHCTTQQEVDFAISKCTSKSSRLYKEGLNLTKELERFPVGIAIDPYNNSYCNLDWYGKNNAKIYSFQEWCKEFNYTSDFIKPIKEWSVGSYAVALKDGINWSSAEKGDIYLILSVNTAQNITKNSHTLIFSTLNTNFSWFPTLQEAEIFSRSLLNNNFANVLKEFPSEGCVYEDISQLDSLVNYLLNRPLNKADGKIQKSEAIGIAWNRTSCWWLKTNKSEKPIFKLTDLKNFLSKENNNSIVEYVECIKNRKNQFTKGKTYKCTFIHENNWYSIEKDDVGDSNGWGKENFITSTKSAYENQFNQYPLIKEECYSSEIEIGDEVEITHLKGFKADSNCIYLNSPIGSKFKVKNKTLKYSVNTNEIGIKINDDGGYWYPIECFKLIKKASQTAIATKVDVSSPKVGNKLLLFKKRESTTLPNVERTKLKIFKQKLIKI